jgi:hypothetical protein
VSQAAIRNFAEAIKAAPYDPTCATAPTSYGGVYSPSPPTRLSAAATALNATSHTGPSLAVANANTQLLAFYALADTSSFTPPNGMTEQYDVSSAGATSRHVTASMADQSLPNLGPTGTRVAGSAALGDSIAQMVSLSSATGAANSIVRRGAAATGATVGGTTISLDKPAGTVVGDAMVAHIVVAGTPVVTPPVGWLLVSSSTAATSLTAMVFERTATNSTAASYLWSFDSEQEASGGMMSYGGVAKAFIATVTAVTVDVVKRTP